MEKLDVDVSLQMWQMLYDLSIFVKEPDIGYKKRQQAWVEVDFVLDFLMEHNEFDWQQNGT